MDSKLNNVLKKLPSGAVATQRWLEELGVYRQLTHRYVEEGWLERLGHGAFIRAGDRVDWLGGVYAMQTQLKLGVHVGSDTALQLKGLAHFLAMGGPRRGHLFGTPGSKLPGWFRKHDWDIATGFYCPRLFEGAEHTGFGDLRYERFTVRISAPERAVMESIYLAADNASLIHSHHLMEGLSTLRPAVVQELLEACWSVRVKRYFLWSAGTAGHAWFRQLNPAMLDLGAGKRQLFKGGGYDATYRITVPPANGELPDV